MPTRECVWVDVSLPKINVPPPLLLPRQWKYWHRAKNRLRDKTGFGMYNPQNVEESGFGQSVCVSVCLAVAFPASSHRRKV